MLILGIETSCDETSASVMGDNRKIKSNIVASQSDIHSKYGGVVPELACRRHIENINIVIKEALDKAGVSLQNIDIIAATCGPGLAGALLVGLSAAKGIAYALQKPLVGVNHIEGHILSVFLTETAVNFPYIALVASGGHTDLYLVKGFCEYKNLGSTRDDAVGESFDKVAKMLGLGYPGGPLVEKTAKHGNPEAIHFPRAYLSKDSLDFSFSGVKTAVKNYLTDNTDKSISDISASFQAAVFDVIVDKLMLAAERYNVKSVAAAGGVASNKLLRKKIYDNTNERKINVYYPSLSLCTDNAAMIAYAGYHRFKKGSPHLYDFFSLDADPRMSLDDFNGTTISN